MKKIFFACLLTLSLGFFSSVSQARNNIVVAGGWGGWGGWGGGVYVGYPGYYGYGPVPVVGPGYVPYPAYQPYYGYYPYGPVPVATGAPFYYNNSNVSNAGPFQYYRP